MRLIDADALEIVHANCKFDTRRDSGMAYDLIISARTIEPMPMVQSEWEGAIGYDADKKVQCQNCFKMAHEPTAYCPHCGAKMDAGGGDTRCNG